jgi:chemotaxis protein methyltransferase CheR
MPALAAQPVYESEVGDRFSPREFAQLARFIEEYSGIKMPTTKKTMVEGRLRRRVRANHLASLSDYHHYLFQEDGLKSETIDLIDAVTTNKTEFFREPEHFRVMAQTVLPEIAKARSISSRAPLKMWSAACSTGAEPYTMAMVASDFGQGRSGFQMSILGTDLCTAVLEVALRGIYAEAMVAPVPRENLRRHVMTARDPARQDVRIVPELRRVTRYGRLNLMAGKYTVDTDMDIIFCRNILIYFDKPTQEAVLNRLCSHLRPGGYLFLGHSESLAGLSLPLKPIGNTVFRRA